MANETLILETLKALRSVRSVELKRLAKATERKRAEVAHLDEAIAALRPPATPLALLELAAVVSTVIGTGQLTAPQIAEALALQGVERVALRDDLSRLVKRGHLIRVARGTYAGV